MKINLILKNFIILVSVASFINGAAYIKPSNKEKYKNKYGIQFVYSNVPENNYI